MIITRKIELWLNVTKEETKSEAWKRLRQLENDTFEMANLIVNHQFYNALHKERLMTGEISVIKNTQKALGIALKSEKDKAQKAIIEDKIKANKEKISELMKAVNEGIKREFGTSESNSTYQIIGNKYPSVSSEIRTCLNQEVSAFFNKELFDVQRGVRSLRTYKKGLPIPFGKSVIRFYENGKDINFNWVSDFDFKLNFGRDKSNNREIVERVMRGEYDVAGSHIQIDSPQNGDTKIFLLLCVDMPKKEVELKNDICVGIDLGINIPLYAATNKGFGRMSLGSREAFLKERLKLQMRRKEIQSSLKTVSGGHGRKKKLQALDHIGQLESNWVKTYNHKLSKQVIDFAVSEKAATIKLELLAGFGEDEKNAFLLRNWSYYQLQEMIGYKAKMHGIEVVHIDPYHTSQTCSCCGHYEKGQRLSQSIFQCLNPQCKNKDKKTGENFKVNADYNAALNVAKSDNIVTKKEDCQYHKLQSNKFSKVAIDAFIDTQSAQLPKESKSKVIKTVKSTVKEIKEMTLFSQL